MYVINIESFYKKNINRLNLSHIIIAVSLITTNYIFIQPYQIRLTPNYRRIYKMRKKSIFKRATDLLS